MWATISPLPFTSEKENEKRFALLPQEAAFPKPARGVRWVEWGGEQGYGGALVCLLNQVLPDLQTNERAALQLRYLEGQVGVFFQEEVFPAKPTRGLGWDSCSPSKGEENSGDGVWGILLNIGVISPMNLTDSGLEK